MENRKEVILNYPIKLADSYWKRVIGLLLYKKPITGEGLLITPCNAVHMFFMRFSIDVVFLDSANNTVKCIPELKPWRMVPTVKDAVSALELPSGTIDRFHIENGDKVIYNEQSRKGNYYAKTL